MWWHRDVKVSSGSTKTDVGAWRGGHTLTLGEALVSAIQTERSGWRWTIKPANRRLFGRFQLLLAHSFISFLKTPSPTRFVSPFCYPLCPSHFLSLRFLPCALSLFLPVSDRHLLFLHCCCSIFRPGVTLFAEHIVPTYEDTVIPLSWEVLEPAATYISALIFDTSAHDLTSTFHRSYIRGTIPTLLIHLTLATPLFNQYRFRK